MKQKCLPQEGLKFIACLTMLLDHIGATLVLDGIYLEQNDIRAQALVDLYYVLRCVGRISFPIFCFLLAEGVRRTRNPKRYCMRLFLGVLLAELPFDLVFQGGIDWSRSSVMVTLLLGALYGTAAAHPPKRWQRGVLALPFMLAAQILGADYGFSGMGIIAMFLLTENLPWKRLIQTALLLLICLGMNSVSLPILGRMVPIQVFAVLSMAPISLYSGRKLSTSRVLQWAFYLFYPVHLAALWLLSL